MNPSDKNTFKTRIMFCIIIYVSLSLVSGNRYMEWKVHEDENWIELWRIWCVWREWCVVVIVLFRETTDTNRAEQGDVLALTGKCVKNSAGFFCGTSAWKLGIVPSFYSLLLSVYMLMSLKYLLWFYVTDFKYHFELCCGERPSWSGAW